MVSLSWLKILVLVIALVGFAFIGMEARNTVTIEINTERRELTAYAFTVGDALRVANIYPGPKDHLAPPADTWLTKGQVISLVPAAHVQFWVDGDVKSLLTTERLPVNLLSLANISLNPGDQILVDGTPYASDQPLPVESTLSIQVRRAFPITLQEGAETYIIYSSAATLGQALWEAGIKLHAADQLTPSPNTPLIEPIEATLERSQAVTIHIPEGTIHTRTAAATVGEALAEAGLSLQGMDFSQPSEDLPLPVDGQIQLVRVQEDLILELETLPFETLFQPLHELAIDNRQVIHVGEFGLRVRRVTVRYENGQEISRQAGAEWVAAEPKPRIVGYGTNIVVRTTNTPDGPIEYWRAVDVFATSYSPCRLGIPDYCNNVTASGLPLRKGVAAVVRSWYNAMGGQQVYVPGYGTAVIADFGGGIAGGSWIDLGYSDDNFVSWGKNVTIYFRTPTPPVDQILWTLP